MFNGWKITTRVSGAAVSRPLDPLVMRFINKEELMTGNEDLTVQFGEDPPWDDLPPVDREKANKELESRLIFDSWTCRFCGGTFADRTLAIKHAIDCDDKVSEPKIPKGFVMIYTETHSICMRIDHIVSVAVAVGVNHTLHITTRDGENYKAAYNFEEFLKLLDAANEDKSL